MAKLPEVHELVVATVKKIMPYGAFCSLDEYPGNDAFIHVSQVSTGWVRNIREHLREGQKIVARVSIVDTAKGQIDISVKQVSESDRKNKLESYQAEKKARKLIEVAGAKLGKNFEVSMREVGLPLSELYAGSVAEGLEAFAAGNCAFNMPALWAGALKDLVEKEFKAKVIKLRAKLSLKFLDSNGVEKLRDALAAVEASAPKAVKLEVLYLGAPNYYVDVESADFKLAEKAMTKVDAIVASKASSSSAEYSFEVLR